MSYFRKNKTKFVLAVTGGVALMAMALWQLNLFLLSRNDHGELDMAAGMSHLWWSLALGGTAAIITFLVFSILVRYDRTNERTILSRSKGWKIGR